MTYWRCLVGFLGVVSGLAFSQSVENPDGLRVTIQPSSEIVGRLVLEWTGLGEGYTYQVESRRLFGSAESVWEELGERQEENTSFVLPNGLENRFFRVVARPADTSERGRLISVERVGGQSALFLRLALLFISDIPAGADLSVDFDVALYKLVYETIDPSGGSVVASAAVALPEERTAPLPVAIYQHPTLVKRDDGPSNPDSSENLGGIFLAADGYATVMPDYLGFGESDILHPFLMAEPTATASVDALRAFHNFAASEEIATKYQLFILGYSEGGYAAMALHRELEIHHQDEFPVTASAPMAGPYDLEGTIRDYLTDDPELPRPFYLAYALAAYGEYGETGKTFAEMLKPELATVIPPLFNGLSGSSEIDQQLPRRLSEMLEPSFYADLRNNRDHPLLQALRENNVYDWAPLASMRLFHCLDDEVVDYANAETALARFHELGATHVDLVNMAAGLSHEDCALPSVIMARQWLNSFR